jgi:hypothetical protein
MSVSFQTILIILENNQKMKYPYIKEVKRVMGFVIFHLRLFQIIPLKF